MSDYIRAGTSIPYRDTGFEYIKGSKSVLFSNGVLLGLKEFETLDRNGAVVLTILQKHKEGKDSNYDYIEALNSGVLRKLPHTKDAGIVKDLFSGAEKHSYEKPFRRFDTQEYNGEPDTEVVEDNVEDSTAYTTKDDNTHTEQKSAQVSRMVEIVMTIVALGSASMSTYHTTVFMHDSGKPLWSSLMTGVIMIFFSATAFTAGRYFLQEKAATAIFGIIFIIMGCGVVFYSMFSTVTVNFDQYSWEAKKDTESLIEASSEVQYADQMRTVMEQEVARLDGELTRLREEAEYWKSRSWAKFDDIQKTIATAEEKRSEAWSAFISHTGVRAQAEQIVAKSNGTIYSFLSNLFGIREDILFFIIYTIPAVFYDIASPFGFTIILLLQDRRRREKK